MATPGGENHFFFFKNFTNDVIMTGSDPNPRIHARTQPMAGFRPNSEIIGKFRKLKKFYGNFVKRQK